MVKIKTAQNQYKGIEIQTHRKVFLKFTKVKSRNIWDDLER